MISLLSQNFVPVGINLNKVRPAKDADAEFYRSVYRQKPQYQGFWIVSPQGKVLAAHHEFKSHKTWTAEVLEVLQAGRRAFGDIPPRQARWEDPLPLRGRGVWPDGSVTVVLYVRYVFDGRLQPLSVLDSLTLSAGEWAAFAPPQGKEGVTWAIPDKVARKFSRCLSPDSDLVTMPLPSEVTNVHITGKVHALRDDTAIVTYRGQIAAVHRHLYQKDRTNRCTARIEGVAEYNLKTRQLRALALVFDGVFHNFPPYDGPAQPIVAGVEWTAAAGK